MINDLSKVAKVQEQERKRLEVHSELEIFKKKPKIHLSFEEEKNSCTKFKFKENNILKSSVALEILVHLLLHCYFSIFKSHINATF